MRIAVIKSAGRFMGTQAYYFRFGLCTAVWFQFLGSVICAQTLNDPNLRITQLVGGLNQPTAMAFIGANDLLV